MPPLKLADLIGKEVLFLIPRLDANEYQKMTLLGVEAGGVWVQSNELTGTLLRLAGLHGAPNTPVFFWPYHEIAFALAVVEGTSLDEKAFGL